MMKNWAAYCSAVILMILVTHITKSECGEMIPVDQVSSTGLFTGVWYRIDLKNNGSLGYSNKKDVEDKYNRLTIDRSIAPGDEECGQGGGAIKSEMEWMLVPTEKKGRYLIQNHKSPKAAIGWHGKSPSGKWVVAHLGHGGDAVYQENGEYRPDVLWGFENAGKGYHNVYNDRFPDNGIMTWSFEGSSDTIKYVQIIDTGSPDSVKSDGDYQWKFTRSLMVSSVKSIPGTSLYTGVQYRVILKSKGLLTWSFSKVENRYYHIQIVFGEEMKKYDEGKKWYKDSIWMIQESEQDGKYQLFNMGLPDAAIGWAGKSPSGKYVMAYDKHANDPDNLEGGKYRQDVLWTFETEDIKSDDTKPHLVYNSRFPKNGIMTWTTEDTGSADRKYVQIYDSGSPDSYKHNKDYLWSFIAIVPK